MHKRWIVVGILASLVAATRGHAANPSAIPYPRVVDDRLTIELYAREPDIVTPFGITVDPQGRVFVVESHTHMRPGDYEGPPHDRLRLLVDTDKDGRADSATSFYEGDQWLMNVAAHPNGWLYAIHRNELFRIRDTDDDGVADQRESIARLQTQGDYPHNGFLSLTFDFDGNIYVGLGQNFGAAYVLTGRGGERVSSKLGDGGVFRCSEEGDGLTRLANGFWNPCGLAFDVFGRLFTVDNDPGNRPPCRFIEVVAGGDFGYRRHALEPFISWNGELPGTLPMITSTPEAPTAVVAYESDHLPKEFLGDLLVSSWSEYRIDRFRLRPRGASFETVTEPLAIGSDEFRPAGIAVAPDGSLLISDWVDRSYPVHGRGRVWRIRRSNAGLSLLRDPTTPSSALVSLDRSAREAAARRLGRSGEHGIRELKAVLNQEPSPRIRATMTSAVIRFGEMDRDHAADLLSNASNEIRELAARSLPIELVDLPDRLRQERDLRVRAAMIRRLTTVQSRPAIISAILSDDPMMSQAASYALENTYSPDELRSVFRQSDATLRRAAFLSIRRRYPDQVNGLIDLALDDESEEIRFAAIEWIAQNELAFFRTRLLDDLFARPMSAQLFEATLAAIAQIDGVMQNWRPGRNGDWWKSRSKAYDIAARLLASPEVPRGIRRRALEFLPASHDALTLDRLIEQMDVSGGDVDMQLAVVRVFAQRSHGSTQLQEIAADEDRPLDVRAEAVLGLDPSDSAQRSLLMRLATDAPATVQHEALRSLRGVELTSAELNQLDPIASRSDDLAQLVARVSGTSISTSRPPVTDTAQWLDRVGSEGDPTAGARVFFHPRGPGCAKCHRIDGRGETVGPGFRRTHGVASFTKRQLIRSILEPSQTIALGYVAMHIVTHDGRVHVGIPRTESDDGEYSLVDATGQPFSVRRTDIEEVSPHSQSIMPDGLVATMTDKEFRDVVAYILQPASSQRQ